MVAAAFARVTPPMATSGTGRRCASVVTSPSGARTAPGLVAEAQTLPTAT